MNKKFKIYTLGCKVNQYDSARLAVSLVNFGWQTAISNADIAIINTCCVTKTAIHKGQRMLNKAKKENPIAKIILMGCWPQVYKNEINKNQVDLIWGVGEHKKLVKEILNLFLENKTLSLRSWVTDGVVCNDRSRYFIKIQDGCEQFCSYCIIPYARGKLKSRDETEVVKEIKEAIKLGYREIVLCGIHLGLYKSSKGAGLADLIKKIIKIPNLGRIRLSSIEITDVNDKLIKLMATSDKICNHLHIP
jgi:threonylcarbamoyladenosine tRNA methylthiotransferase MtaB